MCLIVDKIPTGNSYEDKCERRRIIKQVYDNFFATHPYHRTYNFELNKYIYVQKISIQETVCHAAATYLSTLAVIQIDTILKLATFVREVPTKPNTNSQKKFEKMIIMNYSLQGVGDVKLTVGIRKRDNNFVQYCITAIDTKIP